MTRSACRLAGVRTLWVLCFSLWAWGATGPARAATLSAGAAKASITPTAAHLGECVRLGGFGTYTFDRGCSTGVHADVHARALAVRVDGQTAVLAVLDAPGIGNKVLDAIRSRASAATGVPANALFVGATHTHSGPDLQGLWGGVPGTYRDFVVGQTVAAIQAAVGSLQPATLRAGSTAVSQALAHNRRDWGYTDTTMTVLQFTNAAGTVLGTLTNFAAHPTLIGAGNLKVAPDFVGALNDATEQRYGGVSLFFNADQGDVSPVSAGGADEYQRAAVYGATLAAYVPTALTGATVIPAGLKLVARNQTFNVYNDNFKLAYHLGVLGPYYNIRVVPRLDGLWYYIDSRVVRLRLGDAATAVELVSLPGEATTRLGLDLRNLLAGTHEVLLGLDHDTLGYFLPRDEYGSGRNGGYEESVSLERDAGEKVRAAVQWLVQQ